MGTQIIVFSAFSSADALRAQPQDVKTADAIDERLLGNQASYILSRFNDNGPSTGGMPVTFIKFQDQFSSTKVLGVGAGHWMADFLPISYQTAQRNKENSLKNPTTFPLDQFYFVYGFKCSEFNFFKCINLGDTESSRPVNWAYEDHDYFQLGSKLLYLSYDIDDLVIVEFNITYDDLEKLYNIKPFIVSKSNPQPGELIYFHNEWRTIQFCEFIRSGIDIKMGNQYTDHEFEFSKMLEFQGLDSLPSEIQRFGERFCYAQPGTSGSAVLAVDDNEIFGVTSSLIGGKSGIFKTYVQPISHLRDCFDDAFKFDLHLPTCRLNKDRK